MFISFHQFENSANILLADGWYLQAVLTNPIWREAFGVNAIFLLIWMLILSKRKKTSLPTLKIWYLRHSEIIHIYLCIYCWQAQAVFHNRLSGLLPQQCRTTKKKEGISIWATSRILNKKEKTTITISNLSNLILSSSLSYQIIFSNLYLTINDKLIFKSWIKKETINLNCDILSWISF